MKFGCLSEVAPVRRLLLKHPRDAFKSEPSILKQWKVLNYEAPPDYKKALAEYERFLERLEAFCPDIEFLPHNAGTGLDSMYVRDSSVVTRRGLVLANMGKKARSGEPSAVAEYFEASDIPVIGAISGEGRLEGGDVVQWDGRTLLVGWSYRTNEAGIQQLREFVEGEIEEFVVVPLPHWKGPGDVLHLMSLISPVDDAMAVVYPPLLPVAFREWLDRRSVKLIEVPEAEFGTMACNVLALAPGRCLMLEGNPQTRQKLEAFGVEVFEYRGQEISVKGAGGPTCLTRPLLRENP